MDLHKECEKRIRAAVELARERCGLWMPYPRVAFVFMDDDNCDTWATTWADSQDSRDLTININQVMLEEYGDKCYSQIATHEVAHLVAIFKYGDWTHGPTWQNIAAKLGCPPDEFTDRPRHSSHS